MAKKPKKEIDDPPSWRDRLFEPVDAGSIVFFRITFGVMMLFHVLEFFEPHKIELTFTTPSMLFKYYGFSWVAAGSLAVMRVILGAMAVCAVCIALGLFYRLAAVGFFVGFVYLFLLDVAAYDNHDYLIALLAAMLAILPAHRAGSLDARRKKDLRGDTLPAWCLYLLRFQVAIPYTLGGVAKLNYDWLVRGEPIGMWLRSVDGAEGSFDMAWFRESWSGHAFAWGGTIFDLAVVPLLLWRPTRIWAYGAAVAFHLSNSQMFNIGIFPWLMICATTIYFEPDWPRRVGLIGGGKKSREKGSKKRAQGKADEADFGTGALARAWIPRALALWMAIQLLVPFRHFLYPGHVDWTEEGHRFAWRMKLRHKEGQLHFAVVDKATRQTTVFKDFTGVLTHRQQRHLLHDPEMMRQFAHRLARQLKENGQGDVEVRALTHISLNGRKPAPLIDPEVDLASEPRRLGSAPWIVPFDPEATLPD